MFCRLSSTAVYKYLLQRKRSVMKWNDSFPRLFAASLMWMSSADGTSGSPGCACAVKISSDSARMSQMSAFPSEKCYFIGESRFQTEKNAMPSSPETSMSSLSFIMYAAVSSKHTRFFLYLSFIVSDSFL